MQFAYKAVDAAGRIARGSAEAASTADLEARLRRLGLDLIDSRPASSGRGHRRVKRSALINFFQQLEHLLAAGVPLLECLEDLRDSDDMPTLSAIAAALGDDILGGHSLSAAMRRQPQAFSPLMASLVEAGETSGRLPETLARIADSLKWEDELAAQAKKLLIYPAVVAVVVLSVSLFLMVNLVPQLKSFVQQLGQPIPLHARALFALSGAIGNHGFAFAGLALAVAAALGIALGRPESRSLIDRWLLKLPLAGTISAKIALSRFVSTFAMLYEAGVPVLVALEQGGRVAGNGAICAAIECATQAVRDGSTMAHAFRDALIFPPFVVRMLRVGETTGRLDVALRHVAYFYERDIRDAVGRTQAVTEPALTLLLGALLGWIMLSVIGPIYDALGHLKT